MLSMRPWFPLAVCALLLAVTVACDRAAEADPADADAVAATGTEAMELTPADRQAIEALAAGYSEHALAG